MLLLSRCVRQPLASQIFASRLQPISSLLLGTSPTVTAKPQQQPQQRRHVSGISQTSPSKLSEVLKMETLEGKTGEEVSAIWIEAHTQDINKGRAGSVMSKSDWELYQERARKSPMFVLPLAKPGGGYVTLVSQMQLPFALVTSLEEYRRHGANAPSCFNITHYTELLDSLGIVLLRGDCVNEKLVNQLEGRTLLELLRALYTDGEDYKQVLDFNHNPSAFDFEKLLVKLKMK